MCRVMGLDLSLTSTGMVVLKSDGTAESMALTSEFKDAVRLAELREKVRVAIQLYRPKLVVIEGYSFGSRTAVAGLAELGGVVKCELFEMQQPFIVVPPARLKKFACGRGNAKKDEIRLAVYKRWGFEAPTTDEVDAYVLARIGLAYLGYDTDLIKPQLEVIQALTRAAGKRPKEKVFADVAD